MPGPHLQPPADVSDTDILMRLRSGESERRVANAFDISRHRVRAAKTRAARVSPDVDVGESIAAMTDAFRVHVQRPSGQRARITNDTMGGTITGTVPSSVSKFIAFDEPTMHQRDWKAMVFTDDDLSSMSPAKLFARLLSSSPEIAKGAHDFVRLFNPGNSIHAYKPGTDDYDERGEAAIADYLEILRGHYVSINVLFSRIAMSLFSRGAILAETVLDDTGRRPVDLVIADPTVVSFRRAVDEERGAYWQMGQWVNRVWTPIESETVAYVAFDPLTDSPYGRAPIMPALFPALFLMGFLQDLRRVVANAGYNRIALSVDVAALYEIAKQTSKTGTVTQKDFMEFLSSVKRSMNDDFRALEPGDALIKDSTVAAENLSGTISTMNPGTMDGIITALERMCVKAVKSIPLLHGITESTSDANANRQWEMLVAAIKDMQHLAEDVLSRLLRIALQVQGINCDVRVEFAELRAAEMLRDEQTDQLRIQNAEHRMKLGFLTPNEAAIDATGDISAAVKATYTNPDGSAAEGNTMIPDDSTGGPVNAATVSAEPSADRRKPDARLARKAKRRRALVEAHRAVSTTDTVSAFDEEEAARVFDEMVPAFAGLLDAEPITEDDAA